LQPDWRPIDGTRAAVDHAPVADTSGRTTWQWHATGTVWRVHHHGGVDAAAAERVRRLVEADEARWSRFRPESDTARISAAAGTPVAVSEETLALLDACRTWIAQTGGVFQPLVGAMLAAWGYAAPAQAEPPLAAEAPPAEPVAGTVEVDRAAGCARIPAGSTLDLGGVAKGWIADRAARLLAEAAPGAAALVDAGGDMAVAAGVHEIAVVHTGRRPVALCLQPGSAVATSGPHARSWPAGAGRAHHLIDPATGAPGTAAAAATVIAASCAEADVWAKAFALRPHLVSATPLAALVTGPAGDRTSAAWPG
jgi:FAD:protein FMN transferase